MNGKSDASYAGVNLRAETVVASEQRRCQRYRLQLPVDLVQPDSTSVLAYTRDLSARGLLLTMRNEVPKGSDIGFVSTFPPAVTLTRALRVRCTGKVVRVTPEESGNYGIAVEINRYEFLSPWSY